MDQRIERANGADIACFGSLDAQVFGLAVDAFAGGTLVVNDVVEGTVAIQGDAHQPAGFQVDIFDTAFLLAKLLMVTGLAWSARERAADSDSVGRGSHWYAGTGRWGACASRGDTAACHQASRS